MPDRKRKGGRMNWRPTGKGGARALSTDGDRAGGRWGSDGNGSNCTVPACLLPQPALMRLLLQPKTPKTPSYGHLPPVPIALRTPVPTALTPTVPTAPAGKGTCDDGIHHDLRPGTARGAEEPPTMDPFPIPAPPCDGGPSSHPSRPHPAAVAKLPTHP